MNMNRNYEKARIVDLGTAEALVRGFDTLQPPEGSGTEPNDKFPGVTAIDRDE
jgi:hypothetical protein